MWEASIRALVSASVIRDLPIPTALQIGGDSSDRHEFDGTADASVITDVKGVFSPQLATQLAEAANRT